MTRPCDLLPGISVLASMPAPRPRTIHAMMPITGLLYFGALMAGSVPDRDLGLAWPRRRDTLPSGFHLPANPGRPVAETGIDRKHHHLGRDHGAGGDVTRGGDPDDRPAGLARRRDGPYPGTQSKNVQARRGGCGGDAGESRWGDGDEGRAQSHRPGP